ncbi:dual specificity phosphatase, catalytic domain-containing protein [Ditylenchus destructor]|uniref:protein-serine/threonine phosphatase n=1 Tax=Ditylenchus destructor TaxID=166010 RepID=A0AAD4R9Z2_9BILA|nr:dual specificity phosphatase, catalytic domain-containing protein [Ditylenchus destructor]
MDLASALKRSAQKLKPVKTTVTLENGLTVVEERAENGEFNIVFEDDEEGEVQNLVDDRAGETAISKRRTKKVERARRYGFIIDLKPDLQLANIATGIYLSSQDVAQELDLLASTGITHVVNAATAVSNFYPKHFKYLALPALDCPTQDLRQYFDSAFAFMHEAVEKGGKVLVHCNAGISRSSTIAIAYIMKFEKKSLNAAFQQVKTVRTVARPNVGFMQQLEKFEKELNEAMQI